MTVLVDHQLKDLIKSQKLIVTPMMENAIQPNSIDVRLNNEFAIYDRKYAAFAIDPYNEESIKLGLKTVTDDRILLNKDAFLLAETYERIVLPDDICATIEGKSSLARLGITVHQTGGWIDCGFKGTITLEMTNENIRPVVLYARMPIAQLVFYKTEPAEQSYRKRCTAKYFNQSGPTASRFHMNVNEV